VGMAYDFGFSGSEPDAEGDSRGHIVGGSDAWGSRRTGTGTGVGMGEGMGMEVGGEAGGDAAHQALGAQLPYDGLAYPSAVDIDDMTLRTSSPSVPGTRVTGLRMPAAQSVRHATQFQDAHGVVYPPRPDSSSTSDSNSPSEDPVTALEALGGN